ncbi:TIGR04219 family outer membrane beta-barrel protein [Marinomonas agarivorans]|nr:TIGR04219 family outer membrane beta-barrel protein [Marinomonas agarivorans]
MKPAVLVSSMLIAASAHADFFGATLEAGIYDPDAELTLIDDGLPASTTNSASMSGEKGSYYGIALEHPIPLIPNLRVQGTELVSEGSISTTFNSSVVNNVDAKLDLSHTDYTAYYELLDGLFWLHFDIGVTLRDYEGSATVDNDTKDFAAIIPMSYIAPAISIPGTGLTIGGEIKSLSIGDNSITDTTWKLKWDSGFIFGVEAGIRNHEVTLDDADGLDIESTNEGAFVGVVLDF